MARAGRTLQRSQRIRQRREFQDVYAGGVRRHGRYMTVLVLPSERGVARLGVAASKRIGGAVARNRAKRRIRAIFRGHPVPPGLDVVVAPRRELIDAPFASLEADFRRLMRSGGTHRR